MGASNPRVRVKVYAKFHRQESNPLIVSCHLWKAQTFICRLTTLFFGLCKAVPLTKSGYHPPHQHTPTHVVYFNQHLGAAHSKCWSKYVFLAFFVLKSYENAKSKKFAAKFSKKQAFSPKNAENTYLTSVWSALTS